MTQSVADKTPIPNQASRRHTDPPGLWIAIALISITLHLLIFWLLRSNSHSMLQRSSSNPIPVEFIEISAGRKATSKTKPVLSRRASTTAKSAVARSSKPIAQKNLTPKTSRVEDSQAIAFDNTKKARTSQPPVEDTTQQFSQTPAGEQETQASSQSTPQPEAFITNTPQAQPEPPSQPTPEVTPEAQQPEPQPQQTTLAENPDTQNQGNQELGEQNQVSNPLNNTTDSTRTDSSPETRQEPQQTPRSLPKPDGEVAVGKETPLQDIAPPVKSEQSPPLNEQSGGGGGVGVATWDIEADKLKRDIPENLAQPEDNSRRKELNIVLSDAGRDFQPVDFLVWLTIDKQGNLIFIKVDEQIPLPQRSRYQKYAEEIFQGQKFVAATDKDPVTGEKNPRLSNLPVHVKIKGS